MATVIELVAKLVGYSIAAIALLPLVIRWFVGHFKGVRAKVRIPPKVLSDPSYGTHHYVTVSKDVNLHYVSAGEKNKTLMLFVHGFPEFWYSWRHQIKEFSKDYWTVAVDLRGYGESTKPFPTSSYQMDMLTKDLVELIKVLKANKVILVGHDWGGAVCWNLVAHHPELVNYYICLNIPHPSAFFKVGIRQFLKSWYIAFFQVPFVPEFALSMLDMKFFDKVFKSQDPSWTRGKVSEEDLEAFKYTFGQDGAWTPPLNYYRANLSSSKVRKIPRVKVPVLMVWGDKDVALDVNGAKLSAEQVDDFELHIIEGANHFVQQDAPDLVNVAMRDYLKSRSI